MFQFSKKLFIFQLLTSEEDNLHWICTAPFFSFSECNIQGYLVKVITQNKFWIDDGTGTLHVDITQLKQNIGELKEGMYVMLIGRIKKSGNGLVLVAEKCSELFPEINSECLWNLEVVYLQLNFYSKQ